MIGQTPAWQGQFTHAMQPFMIDWKNATELSKKCYPTFNPLKLGKKLS